MTVEGLLSRNVESHVAKSANVETAGRLECQGDYSCFVCICPSQAGLASATQHGGVLYIER